jgi:hypothetical protein
VLVIADSRTTGVTVSGERTIARIIEELKLIEAIEIGGTIACVWFAVGPTLAATVQERNTSTTS